MGWEMCIAPPAGMAGTKIKQWQQEMVEQGYNLTVQELSDRLRASTAYVSTNISAKVPYINYQDYQDLEKGYRGNILLNRDAAYNWLYKHSTFTRKTVWLNPYMLGVPADKVARYLHEHEQARKEKFGASASVPGAKHQAEEYYERELVLSQELMKKLGIPVCEVHERKRAKIADFQVDKIPYMNDYDLKFNKDFSDVNQCHRHMFRNAAIKVLISTSDKTANNPTARNRGKVFFIEQPRPVGTNAILYPAEIAYMHFPQAVYPMRQL